MTEENLRLRERLKDIESIINAALRSQPEDDEKCRVYLERTLKCVAEGIKEYIIPFKRWLFEQADEKTRVGKWLNGHDYEYEFAYCSECRHMQYAGWETHSQAKDNVADFHKEYRYCPNCGAKMEGGEYVDKKSGK